MMKIKTNCEQTVRNMNKLTELFIFKRNVNSFFSNYAIKQNEIFCEKILIYRWNYIGKMDIISN